MTLICCWVCFEPPPSALKVTLPAFAAERRRLQHGARSCRSTYPACMALSSKPAGRRCCCRLTRQTDGRTLDRYIDPAPHTMRAASIIEKRFFSRESLGSEIWGPPLAVLVNGCCKCRGPVGVNGFTWFWACKKSKRRFWKKTTERIKFGFGFPFPIPHCVMRKFRYFPAELRPELQAWKI